MKGLSIKLIIIIVITLIYVLTVDTLDFPYYSALCKKYNL